jgi:uncharacterized phage protein
MITEKDIEIREISEGIFEATHNEWASGKGKIRKINRRIKNYIEATNEKIRSDDEKVRRQNAPKKTCPRCQGTGHIDHYLHVAHGVCFKCGGSGKVEIKKAPSSDGGA